MIKVKNNTITDEIKAELNTAREQAVDIGRVPKKEYIVPIKVKVNNQVYVGLFTRFTSKDFDALTNALPKSKDVSFNDQPKRIGKVKNLHEVAHDVCYNAVLLPSKEEFKEWATYNQTTALEVALTIYAESGSGSEAEKLDLD